MDSEKKKLIIIDSNAVIHRAFHALPPLTTKQGEIINAVYGFLLVFFKAIKDLKPDFIVAAFDLPLPTFRHKMFVEYKATRPKTPEGISSQIPIVKEVLEKFNVPIFTKEGFEADDIVAAIAKKAEESKTPELDVFILSGDLDILQLVSEKTKVYALRKGVKDTVIYDGPGVRGKYGGLGPENLADFRALRGDPSDNIPGVFGIGEKTAINLLVEFGSLENIYKELESDTEKAQKMKSSVKEKLLVNKDKAFLSKELALLDENVPIDFDLSKCAWGSFSAVEITEVFEKYGFKTLINRLSEIMI